MQSTERIADGFFLRRMARRCVEAIFDKRRGPWRYALASIVVAWLVAVALSSALVASFGYTEEPEPADSLLGIVVLALIMAPVFENLVMVAIVRCFGARKTPLRTSMAVGAAGLFALATHSNYNLSHGLSAAILFAVMAYTYIDWTELSFRKRFALTVAQHALCNLFVLVLMIYAP